MGNEDAVRTEERRVRRLRLLVDVTAQVLAEDEKLTLCEALRLVDAARTAAQRLFPEGDDTFQLVVRPRLDRIIFERFQIPTREPFN